MEVKEQVCWAFEPPVEQAAFSQLVEEDLSWKQTTLVLVHLLPRSSSDLQQRGKTSLLIRSAGLV